MAAAVVAPLAALLTLSLAPGASAAIDPTTYQHVEKSHDISWGSDGGGGFVSCPAGTQAKASGAATTGLQDILAAGPMTTFTGLSGWARARGPLGDHVAVSARCVDAAQLQGSTLAPTVTKRDDRLFRTGSVTARTDCPRGTVAYGGGGFSGGAAQPRAAESVFASVPDAAGTGWVYGVWDPFFSPSEATVTAHCLPRAQFGELATVYATAEYPPGWPPSSGYPTVQTTARCPAGFYAYGGGAFVHMAYTPTPERVGWLTVSTMTADDRGWYARGMPWLPGAQISAQVQCMTKGFIDKTK